MGSVAAASVFSGHLITGSDTAVYPPMSDVLLESGIQWYDGYDASRLAQLNPDIVIIGNAISRGNVELEYALDHRLNIASLAGFVGSSLIDRNTSVVVAGTHGKTSTSSLVAWMLQDAARRPGFLIGGVPGNQSLGCQPVPLDLHNTHGGVFVVEGDEYDTAFFDKRSKFVHYRPTIALINNIEFDHADIFDSVDDIKRSFKQLTRIVPSNGVILANADDRHVADVVENSFAPVELVGYDTSAHWQIRDAEYSEEGSAWTLVYNNSTVGRFLTPMSGSHSVFNCSIAIAATSKLGLNASQQQQAVDSFLLPKRRMEVIAQWNGCTIVDDFAHHPTAIQATISALRQRFSNRRIVVCFEPRSNTTTRSFFQKELAECFAGASVVIIGPINRPERYHIGDRLDTARVVNDLVSNGCNAFAISTERAQASDWGADALQLLHDNTAPGDVIAILSNGNVGGLRSLLMGRNSAANAE